MGASEDTLTWTVYGSKEGRRAIIKKGKGDRKTEVTSASGTSGYLSR